jgi:hypothetical protein
VFQRGLRLSRDFLRLSTPTFVWRSASANGCSEPWVKRGRCTRREYPLATAVVDVHVGRTQDLQPVESSSAATSGEIQARFSSRRIRCVSIATKS